MHKVLLTLAATAAASCMGAVTGANATVLTGPQGLRTAIHAAPAAQQVHCRPGYRHHSYGSDGCYRRVYRGGPAVVVAPRPYPYYGYGGYPYGGYYGGGPGVYFGGPGISIGIGRRGWGW